MTRGGKGRSERTYHVLIIIMQIDARLLARLPLRRDGAVDVGLVDDLGDALGAVLQEVRARRGNLRAVDGVGGPVLEQQRDQGAEGIEERCDDHEIDHQEGDRSSPHDEGAGRGKFWVGRVTSSGRHEVL